MESIVRRMISYTRGNTVGGRYCDCQHNRCPEMPTPSGVSTSLCAKSQVSSRCTGNQMAESTDEKRNVSRPYFHVSNIMTSGLEWHDNDSATCNSVNRCLKLLDFCPWPYSTLKMLLLVCYPSASQTVETKGVNGMLI